LNGQQGRFSKHDLSKMCILAKFMIQLMFGEDFNNYSRGYKKLLLHCMLMLGNGVW